MASKSRGRGEISELTHVAPIKQGLVPGVGMTYADRLRTVLEAFHSREDQGFPGVIRLFRGIHTAQWAMLDGDTRLMLNVVFDGDLRGYLRALAYDIPGSLGIIWSNCEGWRATHEDPQILIDFIERHQVRNSFFYAQYPEFCVPDLEALVHLRKLVDADAAGTTTVAELRKKLHLANIPAPVVARTRAAWDADGRRDASKKSFEALVSALYPAGQGDDYAERALEESFRERDPVHPQVSPELERAELIQGNIIEPYAQAHCARMLFIHFSSPDAARAWLRAQKVRYFRDGQPGPYLTVGFTCAGLQALGVDAAVLSEFPDAFVQGMDARSRILGDAPQAARRPPWTVVDDAAAAVHAVVWVHADPSSDRKLEAELLAAGNAVRRAAADEPQQARGDVAAVDQRLSGKLGALLDRAVKSLGLDQPADGVRRLGYQDLHMPLVAANGQGGQAAYPIEYFGFRDGIGQPHMPTEEANAGARDPGASFDAVLVKNGRGLLKNASFLVARQLRQDPGLFWEHMQSRAEQLRTSKRKLAEQIVGRQMDGRRLDHTDTPFDAVRDRYAFEPGQDRRCPLHSHARRMNPRTESSLGLNPQLMRRSLAYIRKDGTDYVRGLMFMAFNADIETQFEFMQRHWAQAGNQIGQSSATHDVLTGLGTDKAPARFYAELMNGAGSPSEHARELTFDKSFVELEWGIYLFVPAREALNSL